MSTLQRSGQRASTHSFFFAAHLAAYQQRNALTDQQMADLLGCSLDNLARLRPCCLPTTDQESAQVAAHGQVERERLTRILQGLSSTGLGSDSRPERDDGYCSVWMHPYTIKREQNTRKRGGRGSDATASRSQPMNQANTQGADIRQKQAVVLIDGENIAVRYAHSLHHFLLADLPKQQAYIQELNLFGKDTILRPWQAVSLDYPFRSHINAGGKNVTDHAMQQEALALADRGISLFYLVSNDGGFTLTVSNLRARGCHVICLGNALSRKLKRACSDFFILMKRTDVIRPSDAHLHHSQGELLMNTFLLREDYDPFAVSPSNDIQTAIQLLYQSPCLPDYFPRLLHLFLEQTFRALCLTEQESEMTYPGPLPADSAKLLEALTIDPLFQQFLREGNPLEQQLKAVLAFAQRCEFIHGHAYSEAKSAFQAYPQTAVFTDLVKECVRERLNHWHQTNSFDAPEKYRQAYCVIPRSTSEAEQVVMQRWYRRGFQQGARDAATQHQAWGQTKESPREEEKQE